jgi:hypothetical protein
VAGACGGSAFQASSGDGGIATTDAGHGADTMPSEASTSDGPVTGDSSACLGTTKSCGTTTVCVDCTLAPRGPICVDGECGCKVNLDCALSPQGTACVSGACGCMDSVRDCPKGYACGPMNQCTPSCAGGLECNGCCDGTTCQLGAANAACGPAKSACQACGGQTPTCNAGACTDACGAGNAGTCGAGFCCNAGTCASSTQPTTCGGAGLACVSCENSSEGHACVAGACGCNTFNDCPTGMACVNNKCGSTCTTQDLCNGGCCDNGSCVSMCPTAHFCCQMTGQCLQTGVVCP